MAQGTPSGGMGEGQQWHGSLRKSTSPHSQGTDKYNRPASRLAAVPKTNAAAKPDPFGPKGKGHGAPPAAPPTGKRPWGPPGSNN